MPLYSARIAATITYTADTLEAARFAADLMQVCVPPDHEGNLPSGFSAESLRASVQQVSVEEVPSEDPEPI